MIEYIPLVPNVSVGNAYTSIRGNEKLVLSESDVCIPKLELGNKRKEVYYIGASLKDLGKKWFAFSKVDIGSFEMMGRLQ
jgi:hypothetical protein